MDNFVDTTLYKDIVKNKTPCFFVSPHLDDAIFSAGGLMFELRKNKIPVTLVNVFTSASKPPYTISIKKFLHSCGYKNADDLYKNRVAEDVKAANNIGVKVINLGFTDALWRKKNVSKIPKVFSKIIPEIEYIYPIYRFSIARGVISKDDHDLLNAIYRELRRIMSTNKSSIILGPAGLGRHTDHLIVRNIIANLKYNKTIYWGDYPYFERDNINKNFASALKLEMLTYKTDAKAKRALVLKYKSQISAIFGAGKIDTSNEFFYKINTLK